MPSEELWMEAVEVLGQWCSAGLSVGAPNDSSLARSEATLAAVGSQVVKLKLTNSKLV